MAGKPRLFPGIPEKPLAADPDVHGYEPLGQLPDHSSRDPLLVVQTKNAGAGSAQLGQFSAEQS